MHFVKKSILWVGVSYVCNYIYLFACVYMFRLIFLYFFIYTLLSNFLILVHQLCKEVYTQWILNSVDCKYIIRLSVCIYFLPFVVFLFIFFLLILFCTFMYTLLEHICHSDAFLLYILFFHFVNIFHPQVTIWSFTPKKTHFSLTFQVFPRVFYFTLKVF